MIGIAKSLVLPKAPALSGGQGHHWNFEVQWNNYTTDMLRTIHYIADMSGAVLLFEASNVEIVKTALPKFPMIANGILTCEVIPLKPYVGLASLFAQPSQIEQ
jgi:hypothetical protein